MVRGAVIFAAGAAAGAVIGAGIFAASLGQAAGRAVLGHAPAAATAGSLGAPDSFAPVYRRVAPAVVSIYSTSIVSPPRLLIPDPFFGGSPQLIPPMAQMSSGSGFFISADGYILTNDHVVAGGQEVEVVMHDEKRLRARVVGRAPEADLAVLRVEGRGFPFVSFADQGAAQVGDWVIAVGNPFGLGVTATAGIVSAYGKDLSPSLGRYLQIDAPLNRGNSGGPTFDLLGRVVGVNTAIFSPNGGSVGIGFAIPADVADQVARRLIAQGG